ncbi:hypothetical protein HaLaN_23507 [Haematococcus lacustris]|uniref:Uncharacterized protein n=1 Tax=Haematococcus lacustris TaxID=44745 RepID=A0A699ZRV3_HAELA|nr:hypothetical protein HaLaN_23507 [Haematococcus lacustris]
MNEASTPVQPAPTPTLEQVRVPDTFVADVANAVSLLSATTVLMAWTLLRGGSCTTTLLWPNAMQPSCHSRSCVDQATLEADTLSCVKQASP